VPVRNVEESIAFYEKLGLRLIVKSLPHYARFECVEGDSTFSLHQLPDLQPQTDGIWIYFEVQNVDEQVSDLADKGIVFDELPNDKPWWWREARLKDLDNNQIIIYSAGANRKNPSWRIPVFD